MENSTITPPIYCDAEWTKLCLMRIALNASSRQGPSAQLVYQREFLACITTTFHLTWLYTIDCLLNGQRYGVVLDMMINGIFIITVVFPSVIILLSVFYQPSVFMIEYIQTLNQVMSVFLLWGIAKTAICLLVNLYDLDTRKIKSGKSSRMFNLLFIAVFPAVSMTLQKYKKFNSKLIASLLITLLKIRYPYEDVTSAISAASQDIFKTLYSIVQRVYRFMSSKLSSNTEDLLNSRHISVASTIPFDLIYEIAKNQFDFEDLKRMRLVNRNWNNGISKLALAKISIPLNQLSTIHAKRLFENYGHFIMRLTLAGSYDSDYDDLILETVKKSPNIKQLSVKNLQSYSLIDKISQSCPDIEILDISAVSASYKNYLTRLVRLYHGVRSRMQIKSPTTPTTISSPFYDVDLFKIKKLSTLDVSGYIHSGRQLSESLCNQKFSLRSLNLSHSTKLSQISKVFEFFPNLSRIDFGYSRIETLEMAFIFHLIFTSRTNLEYLNVTSVKPDVSRALSIFGVQMLPELRRQAESGSKLKQLHICNAKNLKFEEVVVLIAAFPSLEVLGMRGCRKVNLQSYAWILDGCKRIIQLDITDGHPALNDPEFTQMSMAVRPPPVEYSLLLSSKPSLIYFRAKLAELISTVNLEEFGAPQMEAQLRMLRIVCLFLLLCTLASLIYALIILVQ